MADQSPSPPSRLGSLDAYRGFIMLVMASGGFGFAQVAKQHFPDNPLWKFLAYEFDHVPWRGCSLWDLIQPSFMFMVGVALPFSLASRRKKQSFSRMLFHAMIRSTILVWLGVLLRSLGKSRLNFTFEDVLTQMGLGYTFLFLLAWTRVRTQLIAAFAILFVYWAAFRLYPAPPPEADVAAIGNNLKPEERPKGNAAHWDKNTNLA